MPGIACGKAKPQGRDKKMLDFFEGTHGAVTGDDAVSALQCKAAQRVKQNAAGGAVFIVQHNNGIGQLWNRLAVKAQAARGKRA